MWIFVVVACQAICIGWLAQKELNRTGATWFAIALAVDVALILFSDSASSENKLAGQIMAVGFSTLVMAVVLWTLPKVKAAPEDAA